MERSSIQKGILSLTLIIGIFSVTEVVNASFAKTQHGSLIAFAAQNHHGNANRATPNQFRGATGNQNNRFRNNNVNNLNGVNRNRPYRNNPYRNNVNGADAAVYEGTNVNAAGVNGAYIYQGVTYPNLQAYCTAACVIASNGQRTCPTVCN